MLGVGKESEMKEKKQKWSLYWSVPGWCGYLSRGVGRYSEGNYSRLGVYDSEEEALQALKEMKRPPRKHD
jgi:hypothetical protein